MIPLKLVLIMLLGVTTLRLKGDTSMEGRITALYFNSKEAVVVAKPA